MKYLDTRIDWPLNVNRIRRDDLSNTFGMVRKNPDGSARPHQGWDFYAEPGTPCYSIADGKVVYKGVREALGQMLVVTIGNTGQYAAYCHLSNIIVDVDDQVDLGQLICHTGNTGNAISMKGVDQHLHFEIRNKIITAKGLADRISPLEVFKECPLTAHIFRNNL